MKKLITVSILSLLFILSACKKDEETKTDKLCGKYWVVSAASVDPSIPIVDDYGNIMGYTNDLFTQMEPCDKDDVQKYNSDGTFVWDERVKCETGDVQNGSGTWIFNSDETVITESSNGESMSYTIVELSNIKYKFSYDLPLNGITYKLTITCIPE